MSSDAICKTLFFYKATRYQRYKRGVPKIFGTPLLRLTPIAMGEDLRRSTVAHFARKVRGTNIAAAKYKLHLPTL